MILLESKSIQSIVFAIFIIPLLINKIFLFEALGNKMLALPLKNEGQTASVSILQSRRQIDELESIANQVQSKRPSLACSFINRQITSGVIIDWKEFIDSEQIQAQLALKSDDDNEKPIFSFIIQEWADGQPLKVMYKWLRKAPRQSQIPYLLQQEHIYHGMMKNKKKNGEGQYLIIRRFSDNNQKIQSIKGKWVMNILSSGIITYDNGSQKKIINNITLGRSKKHITTYQRNKTIHLQSQRLTRKKQTIHRGTYAQSAKDKDSNSSLPVSKQITNDPLSRFK